MKKLLFLLLLLCSINASATELEKENSSETVMEENTNVGSFDGYSPKAGVKGFIEGGYTIGDGHSDIFRLTFMANAGWQINQSLFVGAGTGEIYYTDSKQYGIPIYAVLRFINKKNLFLDVRAGYSIGDVKGLYLSPSIGYRVGTRNNTAFTFSLGYEYQKAECLIDGSKNVSGLTTKIGFEF